MLCDCPGCGRKEAFVYKDKLDTIRCNRINKCGFVGEIEFEKDLKDGEFGFKQQPEKEQISTKEEKAIKWLTGFVDFWSEKAKNDALQERYRGISQDVLKPYLIDLNSVDNVKALFKKTRDLHAKNYEEMSVMNQRNLILAVKGKDQQVDILAMRSTLNPEIDKKEIQLYVNKNYTRDFIVDIAKDAKTVVIGESAIDGLSFKEIDGKAGVIGLTGSRKLGKLKEYLYENKDLLKDKSFLIATDDDIAGVECAENIENILNKLDISSNRFIYKNGYGDPNEFLVKDRKLFEESYRKQTFLNVNKNMGYDLIQNAI